MKWSARKIIATCVLGLALLGIVVFAAWRIRLANDVKAEFAAIHAAGLPINGVEADAYYAAVPDADNAAVKMADAFELMATYDDQRSNEVASIKFPQLGNALTLEQQELIAGFCAMNSNSLLQAREAIKLPHSRYDMDLSWGAGTLLPHLAKLRTLSRAAAFQSLLDTNTSVEEISTIIGIAGTLDAEPTLISKLVRIAAIHMAVAALERRLNQCGMNENELVQLGVLLGNSAKTNQMANALIGERAMYVQYFRMGAAEIARLSGTDENNAPIPAGPPRSGPQPLFIRLTGFFERDLRFYLQAMDTNISLTTIFPRNTEIITNAEGKIFKECGRYHYILSGLFLPALGSALVKETTGLAEVYTAQAALAVERFRQANGSLPSNLNELVPQFLPAVPIDPFDGQPLRFRLLEKGYLIYSVGKDGQDNGGRERPADAKSGDKTLYDITFTVER
ncbi:MAG TPA: hypothetical protein VK815_15610 [Candidatus Acidoferrales bacterium]|jgi:hypothetical protein|nr:hypothetical protein [Candidatus Acidoferrales bacterium]